MKFFKKILDWLFVKPRDLEKTGDPDFERIDLDKITKELRVLEEARELGAKRLPAENALNISGVEATIIKELTAQRQQYIRYGVRRRGVINDSINKLDITTDINNARQADEEFSRNASKILADYQSEIIFFEEKAKICADELRDFKIKNKIKRPSAHPVGGQKFFLYAFLPLLALIEGVVNATMFATGLDGGWLEGLRYAFLFSGVNIIFGFILARLIIRYVVHVNILKKLYGLLGIILSLTGVIFISLIIMHYRDSLIHEVENAAKHALENILSRPFVFEDIYSIALFGISFIFGIFAILDGIKSDEIYPGYSKVTIKAEEANDDYIGCLQKVSDKLQNLKDNELENLDKILNKVKASVVSTQRYIDDKRQTKEKLEGAMNEVDKTIQALFLKFRQENEKFRNGVSRPRYFDIYPEPEKYELPDFDVDKDLEFIGKQKNLLDVFVNEVEGIKARIQASFINQMDLLKTIEANFIEKEDASEQV